MFVFFGLLLAVTDDTMFCYLTLGDMLDGFSIIVDVDVCLDDVAGRRLISGCCL